MRLLNSKAARLYPALLIGVFVAALTACNRPTATPQDAPASEIVNPAPAQPAPTTPAPAVAQSPAPQKPLAPPAAANAPAAAPAPAPASAKFIAYYFHRTMRCPTCLKIEHTAKESIEKNFAADLKSGRVEWRAVDIEEPANEHFEQDFELESSSLVLVEMNGDKVARWKNLEQVWDLVNDPAGFQSYVRGELRTIMGGKVAP